MRIANIMIAVDGDKITVQPKAARQQVEQLLKIGDDVSVPASTEQETVYRLLSVGATITSAPPLSQGRVY